MYEARFTTKQIYDNYAKSVSKPKSKPAKSRSLGGFEPDPAQRTSTKKSTPTVQTRDRRRDRRGSTYDEVPQVLTQGIVKRPAAKPVKEKGYEKVIRVFNNAMERFGVFDKPTSTYDTVKPQNVYKSSFFSVPKVTTTTLPDMAPAIAANFGLSMGVDPYDPRGRDQRRLPQNTYQSTINTIFTGGGRDEPVKGRFGNMYRPGLMSPPTMDQTKPETPGLTIEDAVNRAILATTKEYVIKPGDTLSKIARRNNTTVKELAEINKIEDVNVIKAGASLRVPKSTMTDTQAAIRRGYERVKPDDGVEVAYNPLALGLPPLLPFEKTNTFIENIGMYGESDHGSTPQLTNDAAEANKPDNEKSLDIGYGHKIRKGSKEDISGEIHGIKYRNEDGSYIPLTKEQKITILKEDFKNSTNLARKSGWDKKLKDKGGSWDELDPKYQNALSSLAINVGGAKAGDKWTKVLDAAMAEDPVAFAKELRRMDAGKYTKGMDNRVMKELFYAGIITSRSEVEKVLPKANWQSGVPK